MPKSLSSRQAALSLACVAGLALPAFAQVEPHAGMLRYPDVSQTQICFAYANDIWVAPKAGGLASPLSSPPGPEVFPRFSPDGKTIAFVGNYDGNRDLYTIPVAGGTPTRVTHHPAGETLADWSPDGKNLVFITNGWSGLQRQTQLWTVPAEGGMPKKLPVPYAGFGSISPDGTYLAYTPHSIDTRTWKRYRGGMATDVWLFNLKDNTAKRITDWEGTDTLPMWAPANSGVVYYLSDNGPEHRLNIWSYEIASGKRDQVTSFKDDDIRWPSMGPGEAGKGEIIFQLGAKLMLLDLSSKQSHEVKITIPGDRPKIRAHAVDAARYITGGSISPSGKRVAVEARGDLYSLPSKEGVVRNLTRTDGVAERSPAWSPDNKWIAYFSDQTGEYELWIRPTDAKLPEEKKDEKKEEKNEDKKPEEAKADAKPEGKADTKADEKKADADAKREPRKLTNLGPGFRSNPQWSPDSKWITFSDQNGRLYLTDVEKSETKEFDKDSSMRPIGVSWSHDSQWITYDKADDGNDQSVVWIANIKTGEKKRVTSPMFSCSSPSFDRKGDFLFYVSKRSITNPTYSDLDLSFVYTNSDQLLMVPLRKDVKNPWLPQSDEEQLKKDEPKKEDKKDAKKEDKKDEAKKDESKPSDKPEEKKEPKAEAAPDDGVSGTWSCNAKGNIPDAPGGVPFSLTLKVAADGSVSGSITSAMGSGSVTGTFAKDSGELKFNVQIGQAAITMTGTIKNGEVSGTFTAPTPNGPPMTGEWTGKRTAAGNTKSEEKKDGEKKADDKKDDKKEVKIDFDGLERRAMILPITPGELGSVAVADGEKVLFSRGGARGSGVAPGIKIFDYKSPEGKEEAVCPGGGFDLSADGKKLLVGMTIHDASAGGGKAQTVPTAGMSRVIDPRTEWKQIFTDAWRIMRDYFYEPTMHGVDWKKQREHYGAMLEDASCREDVNWIISEMISELNIGHAYLGAPGDVEGQPNVNVGLLGCDFELVKSDKGTAYKIAKIYTGADWDADARGPLSQPGVDIKVGDFILAVNGVPIDTTQDPYTAFIGTADKILSLTVNSVPAMDGKEREVLVKPVGSEVDLRYRAWIESKRAYVEQKTNGAVGYIYVPNTGVDGQSDLFRQFYGQKDKAALIIDDRWNGGGQIPTRFIELLNRPVTNYWAKRDGKDWTWPPDSHQGPKAMLINGLAGSGGDMFPWLFKHNKIGKVIGMRTWGGLVGISGNPAMIDGGSITVPNFGFYETDGTWGVEGHGVDPDIQVIDDPGLMVDGGDPQLDAAIKHLEEEIKAHPYVRPQRPKSPDRSGMGIREEDK